MLVIRTQDKKELLQFDENKINVRIIGGGFMKHNKESTEVYNYQLEALEQDGESSLYCWNILGRYDSEEKAISMLDKIQWYISELRLFNACRKLNIIFEEKSTDLNRLVKAIYEVCEIE